MNIRTEGVYYYYYYLSQKDTACGWWKLYFRYNNRTDVTLGVWILDSFALE